MKASGILPQSNDITNKTNLNQNGDDINQEKLDVEYYNDHPIRYLAYIEKAILENLSKFDLNKLKVYALNKYIELEKILTRQRAYVLPMQVLLGIFFTAIRKKLKSEGKFIDFIQEQQYTDKGYPTIKNYMKLAELIKYPWFEKYCGSDITLLYLLYDVLQKSSSFIKNIFIWYGDPILQTMNDVFNESNIENIDFELLLDYYIKYKKDFSGYNIDKEMYYRLYKIRFEFTSKDLNFIKKYSTTPIKFGKGVIITDSDFLNRYMHELLKENKDRNKAQQLIATSNNNKNVQQIQNNSNNNLHVNNKAVKAIPLTNTLDTTSINNNNPQASVGQQTLKISNNQMSTQKLSINNNKQSRSETFLSLIIRFYDVCEEYKNTEKN